MIGEPHASIERRSLLSAQVAERHPRGSRLRFRHIVGTEDVVLDAEVNGAPIVTPELGAYVPVLVRDMKGPGEQGEDWYMLVLVRNIVP